LALSFAENGDVMSFRAEQDTMGEVKVPAFACYVVQTARSDYNFNIGEEKFSIEVITAFEVLKKPMLRCAYRLLGGVIVLLCLIKRQA
jgi:fumarate hydratase class II